jgi:hypothetical protein
MPYTRIVFFLFACWLFWGTPLAAHAKVSPAKYGLIGTFTPSKEQMAASMDSVLNVHPQLAHTKVIIAVERVRQGKNLTFDFYFLLAITMLMGVIRLIDPRYFQNLWKAFRNPTLSSRQLKDQLESASVPSMLMNVLFTIIGGAYVYYLVRLFTPKTAGHVSPILLLCMIIGGMMLIYLAKYFVIRFSGWAFRVDSITEHYVFNVFLINKILAIILLPVSILLAFADPGISGPVVIISFILIGFLFVNRYTRSWQVFGSFFQYSKFHFFTYLCASEILPMAILMKLLVQGLLY